MKSFTIVGYVYNADLHCVSCAELSHSRYELDQLASDHIAEFGGTLDTDPTPYFAGEAMDQSEPNHCGDCGAKLLD